MSTWREGDSDGGNAEQEDLLATNRSEAMKTWLEERHVVHW